MKASLLDEWNQKSLDKAVASTSHGKGKHVLPVAMGGVKEVSCYGCGKEGHKKGDPSCKAGKFDAHPSAPQDYKDRMAKKRKSVSSAGQLERKSPGKPGGKKGKEGAKRHCNAFNFGKGNCRYGAKCHFSHDKEGEKDSKIQAFSPQQSKLVSTLLSAAMKRTASAIAKKNKQNRKKVKVAKVKDKEDSDDEESDYSALLTSCFLAPVRNTIRRDFVSSRNDTIMVADLHSVEKNCGIDSDAGISISTMEDDFLWIDKTDKARNSIQSPAGINGGSSSVGGRGPMCIRAKSGEFLIDPDAVYLEGGNEQSNLRVMSTQRSKMNGVKVVGCFKGTDVDVLQDRTNKRTIELSEEGSTGKKILVLNTMKLPSFGSAIAVRQIVDDIRKKNRSAMVLEMDNLGESNKIFADDVVASTLQDLANEEFPSSIMAFNLAKISDEERSRLFCRRLGYCNSSLLPRLCADEDNGELPKLISLNEDNAILDQAKFKKKAHQRTDPDHSQGRPPWFRVYVDGAGGGKSMGCESYEGAIGSYLFVCSSTGEIHHKLYASHEQFPAAMFQFLVHVESEGNRCHEIYCDTFSVNISAEVEEVAAMFLVKIVPVSAGTPQEVSFVETAHRVVGARARAMMLGASHLPGWCWALAEKYSVAVGRLLPQSTRNWKSSYYLNTLKAPDWRHMFIHVFGAPCMYSPMEGPVHKRAALTLEGFFVGVQHPMALVLHKSDMKLISVSKKKLAVYESCYTAPLSFSSDRLRQTIEQHELIPAGKEAVSNKRVESTGELVGERPIAVKSVKSMRAHTIPVPNTTAASQMRPPTELDASAATQLPSLGEGVVVPEHTSYDEDLASGISALKEKAES